MNPRQFCRERSYHKALFLTYSFDPIFFEQVVLPDLWAGGSSDILVLGDKNQIQASMQMATGQLWHLGRRYLLAEAKHTGAFHSKVFLRLGQKDGVVMLGSGNITSSGWGGNQELGTAWMVGPEHADKGGWLHPFLDDVLFWCEGELESDAVRRMKDLPWLSLTPAATGEDSPVLYSTLERALGPALEKRWAGRQFDEIKVLTGSSDESGAFLRWAHSTFGVKRSIVGVTPSSVSFVPDNLVDLPLALSLVLAPTDRPLHAKFYWFDGLTGPAAVMGSANCSAAAWLLPPKKGGNVESMVIYDHPHVDEFTNVLNTFNAPSQNPADLLLIRPASANVPANRTYKFALRSLDWDQSTQRLQAEIEPLPTPDMTVELLLVGNRYLMTRLPVSSKDWGCELPEGLGSSTAFATVAVTCDKDSWSTNARWINDLVALHHASQTPSMLEPFKALERSVSLAEQSHILKDLQEVAQTLFNDTAAFRDPGFGSGRACDGKEEEPVTPINPNDLIVHLEDHHESIPRIDSSNPGSLSFTGILRLLFDSDVDNLSDTAAEKDELLDEEQLPDDNNSPSSREKENKQTTNQVPVLIEDRFRKRLADQINSFLGEMSSPKFVERCTATQMVQAVSFPLAVSLRGIRGGWVTADLAEKWALKMFSILFRVNVQGSKGLLRAVEARYVQNKQRSTFDDVVGNGTLWMVLVATLGNTNWQGIGTYIDKAVALREVYTAPQLFISAMPGRIAWLIGKIRIDDAHSYLVKVAPTVSRLLNEIEQTLHPIWEDEIRRQNEQGIIHKVGDLFWREKVGWAVCLVETTAKVGQQIPVRLRGLEKDVMSGYYVNVSEIAIQDAQLMNLIEKLRDEVYVEKQHGPCSSIYEVSG